MLRALLCVTSLALVCVSVVRSQLNAAAERPRQPQSETRPFEPNAFFKANCEVCHGSSAEMRFNPYNPEGQMIDSILNGAKAEDTKDMPAFNQKGIDENKAKILIEYMKSIRE